MVIPPSNQTRLLLVGKSLTAEYTNGFKQTNENNDRLHKENDIKSGPQESDVTFRLITLNSNPSLVNSILAQDSSDGKFNSDNFLNILSMFNSNIYIKNKDIFCIFKSLACLLDTTSSSIQSLDSTKIKEEICEIEECEESKLNNKKYNSDIAYIYKICKDNKIKKILISRDEISLDLNHNNSKFKNF